MIKKFSKVLLTLLLIITTLSAFSVSFADETEDTSKAVTTSESAEEASSEDQIHNGDLYLFDNNIVMDKLVDGNVFIFGGNVEITGQVNGNLFVLADKVTFNESTIRYSIFVCANSVYYNGACNDLYVATNNLETTYNSYVVRDVKALSSNATFLAAIGRDVDLISNSVNFGEGENIPVIYGSLRYSADSEIEIPEKMISGDGTVTYTKLSDTTNNIDSIADILIPFITFIITVLVVYAIIKKFAPNFYNKLSSEKISFLKLLKAFAIGLLTIIVFAFLFVILLITVIGLDLAFILLALFILLCLMSVPVLTIVITNWLKPALKIEKTSMFCLILVLVSIIIQGLTLIPYASEIMIAIISSTALGLLINILLPHKELTEEEKIAIENTKKLAKENKEKRKKEKLEKKEAKKQEKLETKETNKNEDL